MRKAQKIQAFQAWSRHFSLFNCQTPEPIDGAGGVETITLIPLKAGKTDVTLTYARPWEGGEQSDQLVYSFEIDKNMQIKMSNAYSLSAEAPLATPTPEIR